jgi:para-aminobenzoate synthetase component 1
MLPVPEGTLRLQRRFLSFRDAPQPADAFATLASSRRVIWLDSSLPGHPMSRFSYLAWDPVMHLRWDKGRATLAWQDGHGGWHRESFAEPDPLGLLGGIVDRMEIRGESPGIPFAGGLVGYFGYDLGRTLEALPPSPPGDLGFPSLWLEVPGRILAYDHLRETATLVACTPEVLPRPQPDLEVEAASLAAGGPVESLEPLGTPAREAGLAEARRDRHETAELTEPLRDTTHKDYLCMVRRAKEWIARGHIYQVNLSQRFSWPAPHPPERIYLALRRRHPAPFSAFLPVDAGHAVLSVSPELFLCVRGRRVETRPIKGTTPRRDDLREDAAAREALRASEKDRAELVMIVDLERNDLGKVCELGSVRVPQLFRVESFRTVHHLVAVVTGELRRGVGPAELLRATFPGGSVTGAPKIRAMEIIAALERTHRSVYTGAIGWIGWDGDMELNIAIRTVLWHDGQASYRVGGAVVADSDPEAEYAETLAKGRPLAETLSRLAVPAAGGSRVG